MKKLFLPVALIISVSTITLPVFSDEVEDSVKQAMDLYKKGEAKQAITQLEYAAQLVRQQRAEGLKKYLPKPLSGWEAEEAEAETAGAAMFGGGTSVKQEYYQGDKGITITITTDSPLLQSMMMMFSNPMIFQSQGAKLKMIKGQQVLLNDDGATAVVNNTYLVQIEGNSEDNTDVLAYASAMNFSDLAKVK